MVKVNFSSLKPYLLNKKISLNFKIVINEYIFKFSFKIVLVNAILNTGWMINLKTNLCVNFLKTNELFLCLTVSSKYLS